MEIEYWWLLALPLFFALGWLAARIDIKHLVSESRALPTSYFKGLNFLLNEQPDKAIEAFIEVVKVEPQTIELHFALGSLFRRRGEVERAIRMHQNLVERADLPQQQKLDALFELAQDYLKAGLLDRAEELFAKLKGTSHEEAALKYLLEIYEQEKDWQKAIDTAQRLEVVAGQSHQKEIANFYCEKASKEIMDSRPEAARPHLEQALAHHRLCVRANMLLRDLEIAKQHVRAHAQAVMRKRLLQMRTRRFRPRIHDFLARLFAVKIGDFLLVRLSRHDFEPLRRIDCFLPVFFLLVDLEQVLE